MAEMITHCDWKNNPEGQVWHLLSNGCVLLGIKYLYIILCNSYVIM